MSKSKTGSRQHPSRRTRWFGYRAGRVLKLSALLVAMMVITLTIAHWGIGHPQESATLRDWMHSTRHSWLAWRFALYAALAWGFLRIWQSPGCRPEYKAPLRRMAIASALFILTCEYAQLSDGGTPS
ncbi:hypothetical protein [Cedecea sp.]|jgi:hypothetical protein|uniref:hypothetical protein n=1 Tax=Cedecea sp. TaxID=1970739 RepID=UPI002F3FCAF5